MGNQKRDSKTNIIEKVGFKLNKPKKYNLVLLNNDFTSFEAVYNTLINIFNKDPDKARFLTERTHVLGEATIEENLTKEIAMIKIEQAKQYGEDMELLTPGHNYKKLKIDLREVK